MVRKVLHTHNAIIGPLSYGGSYKITVVSLSVHPHFGVFLRNGSTDFSDFWQDSR